MNVKHHLKCYGKKEVIFFSTFLSDGSVSVVGGWMEARMLSSGWVRDLVGQISRSTKL